MLFSSYQCEYTGGGQYFAEASPPTNRTHLAALTFHFSSSWVPGTWDGLEQPWEQFYLTWKHIVHFKAVTLLSKFSWARESVIVTPGLQKQLEAYKKWIWIEREGSCELWSRWKQIVLTRINNECHLLKCSKVSQNMIAPAQFNYSALGHILQWLKGNDRPIWQTYWSPWSREGKIGL